MRGSGVSEALAAGRVAACAGVEGKTEMPGVDMSFWFSWPLKAAKRLAMHAVMSAAHAKSSSLTDARITPPITGMRQSHLPLDTFFLYRVTPSTAANAGSAAYVRRAE